MLSRFKTLYPFLFQGEHEHSGNDTNRSTRSPSRNSQQSTMSQLSTVSTPVTTNCNKTPTPSRRGSRESTTTPTQTRKESVKSSRRGSSVSGCQTPTPRQRSFAEKDSEEPNGSLVNGGGTAGEQDVGAGPNARQPRHGVRSSIFRLDQLGKLFGVVLVGHDAT